MVIGKPANYILTFIFQPRHTSVNASLIFATGVVMVMVTGKRIFRNHFAVKSTFEIAKLKRFSK